MRNRMFTIATGAAIALVAATWGMQSSSAQAPGFKRVELQRKDMSIQGREAVLARAEFDKGALVPKHTHPGDEIAYVLEGELTLELEGKPPVVLKAGDSTFVPAGTVHFGKNTAKGRTIILSTYILEKGKPLAIPAK